ncbi:nicotinate-nucleotide--dimethylbenzimidazole phosphoribosyltransferase [Streptomyces sp. NPDC048650]|uniref:nicotinate-nucleotide--dimethylbenzimidazole phosphoribosyltransferase n=1 Tax=Streptomyces sp. NPDC048650 TaxID=3365583 RepID=UPI003713EF67
MTDTGQVPGEGQPENAGGHPGQPQPAAVPSPADAGPTQQPGMIPPADAYSYLEPTDGGVAEDDDLLLMPGAQGAWSEQQAQPMPQPQQPMPQQEAVGTEPMPARAGDHESGGRDSGAVDLSAVRIPQPAAPQPERERAQATPARRPLHMGPPVPDPTGGVVRSLADRGPAGAPAQATGRHAGPAAAGPEYLDDRPEAPAPAEAPAAGIPEQSAAAGRPAAETAPPVAPPPYGERPYDGQLSAEQAYGAAGQGPLPGPQLGEIPSQMPPWDDASAQAAMAPIAETAVPQEAPLPAEQPLAQPMPEPVAEQESPEAAVVAQDAAAAADAVHETVPEETQQPSEAAAPAADESVAETAPVAEVAMPEAQVAEAPSAEEPVLEAETPEAAAPDPAEQTAEQTAEPAAEPAAEPDAAVQQQVTDEQPAPVEQPAPTDAPGSAAEPVVDTGRETQPEAEAAPVAAEPAVIESAVADPAIGEEALAPQAVEPSEPVEQPEQVDRPQPVTDEATEPEAAPVAEAVPAPDAAPQAPAVPAAPESSTPPEEPVIEQPEAQLPADALPQPVVDETPADEIAADGIPADEVPATEQPAPPGPETPADTAVGAAVQAPAEQQPEPSGDAAPDPTAVAAEELLPGGQPEPAGDDEAAQPADPRLADAPVPVQAAAEPAEAETEAEPEAPADRPHEQDPAELVELREDHDDDRLHEADQPYPEALSEVPDAAPRPAPAAGYDDSERAAVHRVMRERRDIRNGFRSDPVPNDVLLRVLEAAHTAPSVGHSQPWDFVVIRSDETRERMHQLATAQRDAYAKSLPKARAKQFRELKIEAILETPVNIVVTADPTRGGRHTLGRHTQPQMAPYSSALAVENLWLAARAEGLGVGWVSFFDEREMVRELGLPEHLEVVAYLCIGYVDEFPDEPELLQAGWSKRRPLSWVVHEETYGRRALPGEEPHDLLQETLQGIRPLDAKALGEAWERQKRMTKPAGALGMLEIISAQLCGLSRKCPPPIPEPAAVAIFAGDHGVHAQGVTPWPQEVTGQMVANFLGGGAVCNAFANQVGAEVCVVDVGVAGELPATPGLLPRKVRPGTADFTVGPAMSQEDVFKAIEVGIETARDLVAAGNKALLTGEMGIANTTTSAALISVYTGVDPVEVTGRGTGINDETHARKVDVVRRALELHQPDPADPIGVLTAVGGLEHAALVGLILGGASLRTPVVLDGVSAGAAALVARAIAPEALAACIAGHRSAEPGHVAALTKLGLRPLVDLDLRLGEGTGALLALPVVQSAARAMHEVATFDSAGVTEKS